MNKIFHKNIRPGISAIMKTIFSFTMIFIAFAIPAQDSGSGNWSDYQGRMSWSDAKAKCASLGMRLPKVNELQEAYYANLTKKWQCCLYWSLEKYSDLRAYLFNTDFGHGYNYHMETRAHVRCLK